jgi:hypothetical protein
MDTRCTLYGELTADRIDMDILTSHCLLLLISPAVSLPDDFEMCILGHMFGGCIGSVAVN